MILPFTAEHFNKNNHCNQGGIIFWLRGSLQDVPDILPKIALIKIMMMKKMV
jgi:hypothetical protein